MKLLCKYSLLASITILIIFIVRVAENLEWFESILLFTYLTLIVYDLIVIGFFGWLVRISAANSPVKKPSIVTIIGYAIILIGTIMFYVIVHNYILGGKEGDVNTLTDVARAIDIIGTLLAVVGIFWLSRFFSKGSKQQIAAIVLAIALVLVKSFTLSYSLLVGNFEDIVTFNKVFSIISITLINLPMALFLFEFSKLKK